MNKQYFDNYFRGYNNKYRDRLIREEDKNFYCTNIVSIVKLYTNYEIDYEDGTNILKSYMDMFDNEYTYYGYIDDSGHIFDRQGIPNLDFAVDLRKLSKLVLLLYSKEDPIVVKRKDRDQYAIKVESDIGYGYVLPIRNY